MTIQDLKLFKTFDSFILHINESKIRIFGKLSKNICDLSIM